MSFKKGDFVFDCFAGYGTTIQAAQNLKRKWTGIDVSTTAVKVNVKRLVEDKAKVELIDEHDLPVILKKDSGAKKSKKRGAA